MAANFKKAGEGGMAGNWIKMRTNLWDDPRVMRLCDETDQAEAVIIGGLYWLWSAADDHTEDGIMPGLTLRAIDRKTGIPGFGQALCSIGWLADHPEGVRLINFDDHNGASAKRRSLDAQRKASVRTLSADRPRNVRDLSASDADASRRSAELEEEEEKITSTTSPSRDGGKFEIHDAWQPSAHFPAEMLRAGIPESFLSIAALAEFISYWKTRDSPARNTQLQWDHKFLQALINAKSKSGGSHANGSSGTRKLTSHERVLAANGAAAAGP